MIVGPSWIDQIGAKLLAREHAERGWLWSISSCQFGVRGGLRTPVVTGRKGVFVRQDGWKATVFVQTKGSKTAGSDRQASVLIERLMPVIEYEFTS